MHRVLIIYLHPLENFYTSLKSKSLRMWTLKWCNTGCRFLSRRVHERTPLDFARWVDTTLLHARTEINKVFSTTLSNIKVKSTNWFIYLQNKISFVPELWWILTSSPLQISLKLKLVFRYIFPEMAKPNQQINYRKI